MSQVLLYESNILMSAVCSFYFSLLVFSIGPLFRRLMNVKAVQGLQADRGAVYCAIHEILSRDYGCRATG